MERELIYFLADLCITWGFCIPSKDHDRISVKEQYHAIEFSRDVVKAEGLYDDTNWVHRIAERFNDRFGTDEINSSTFVDRVRGIKENW